MSALHFLFAWANAPFTIALGVTLLFALLQASGLLGLLAGDGDGDHDVDHEVDADADADVDADHDVDHDADHDHDADGEDNQGIGAILFGPLGIGKIPFSLIWQSYAIVFAITGLALNVHAASASGAVPLLTLAWTFPTSLIAGYIAVAALARVLGPVLSSKGQEATSRAELVGQIGTVISSRVSPEFGEVRVKDKTGHDIRVICKLARGVRVASEREQVVFVDYDDEHGLLVSPLEEEMEK
jgi:membrane protein implicated in regulation of membrane protease activity